MQFLALRAAKHAIYSGCNYKTEVLQLPHNSLIFKTGGVAYEEKVYLVNLIEPGGCFCGGFLRGNPASAAREGNRGAKSRSLRKRSSSKYGPRSVDIEQPE